MLVDESCVGQSKAKCVCAFLQELNDAVKAKFIEEYPEALIETNPSFFSQFTLVVATQVWSDGFLSSHAFNEQNILLKWCQVFLLVYFYTFFPLLLKKCSVWVFI